MNFQDALYLIDDLLTKRRGKELAVTERQIVGAAWYNKTYLTIADDLYLSEGYIKDLAYRLWQQISQVLQVKVTKSNFRQVMENQDFHLSKNTVTSPEIINTYNIADDQSLGVVLIVDDQEDDLKFLNNILQPAGYQTKCTTSASMALKVVEYAKPDIVLLDIKMPEMDGYQVCQLVKHNQAVADIPIIFLSALDGINDKVRAFQVGGIDYITKPFHPEEVILRVRSQMMIQSQKKALLEEIAQHQQTVEILYQSRALLASLLNNSPDGILGLECVRDPISSNIENFAVLVVNPTFIDIFGQLKENFKIGNKVMSWLTGIHPQLFDLLIEVVQTGKSIDQVLSISSSLNDHRLLRFIIVKLGDGCSLIVREMPQ